MSVLCRFLGVARYFTAVLLCVAVATAGEKDPQASGLKHECPDDEILAEIVHLPQAKPVSPQTKPGTATTLPKAAAPVAQAQGTAKATPAPVLPPIALTTFLPKEPGFTLVLSGALDANLELGPGQSPVLVRGSLAVPEGVTLRIKAGTCIYVRGNPDPPPA